MNIKFIYCLLVIVDCAVGFFIAISHASCIFSLLISSSELRLGGFYERIEEYYILIFLLHRQRYCVILCMFHSSQSDFIERFRSGHIILCLVQNHIQYPRRFIVCSQLCGENFCGILSERFCGRAVIAAIGEA